jgi:hypothetical protein
MSTEHRELPAPQHSKSLSIFERSLSMTIMRGEYISEYFR